MNKVMVTEMWTKEKSGKIKHEMFFNGYKPHNYFKLQRGEETCAQNGLETPTLKRIEAPN